MSAVQLRSQGVTGSMTGHFRASPPHSCTGEAYTARKVSGDGAAAELRHQGHIGLLPGSSSAALACLLAGPHSMHGMLSCGCCLGTLPLSNCIRPSL